MPDTLCPLTICDGSGLLIYTDFTGETVDCCQCCACPPMPPGLVGRLKQAIDDEVAARDLRDSIHRAHNGATR
jgi:hypothetical protein